MRHQKKPLTHKMVQAQCKGSDASNPCHGRKWEPGRPWRDSGRSGHQDLPVQRHAHMRRQVQASFANILEGPALAHMAYMGPRVLGCGGSRGNKEQRAPGCA